MIKIKFLIIVFIVSSFISGCTFFGKSFKQSYGHLYDVKNGQIIESSLLSKGRYIVAIPFKAGDGVLATDDLDKVSLTIVRGIYDALAEGKSALEIVGNDKADKGNFLIEGHIRNIYKPKVFSKLFMMNRKIVLGVEGRMIDIETGKMILRFEDEIISKTSKHSHRDLGYLIGENVGRFIINADEIRKNNTLENKER